MATDDAYWMDLSKGGQARGGDDVLGVRFWMEPVLNKLASEGGRVVLVPRVAEMLQRHGNEVRHQGDVVDLKTQARAMNEREVDVQGLGRPVYEDVEYYEIRIPGDDKLIPSGPVDKFIRRRFQERYNRWKQGSQESAIGTPLKLWPGVSRGQAEQLAHFGIATVEQLAAVADGNLANVGPIVQLKQRAKDYLESAKGLAPTAQLRAELEKRDQQIKTMQEQVAALVAAQAKSAPVVPETAEPKGKRSAA